MPLNPEHIEWDIAAVNLFWLIVSSWSQSIPMRIKKKNSLKLKREEKRTYIALDVAQNQKASK